MRIVRVTAEPTAIRTAWLMSRAWHAALAAIVLAALVTQLVLVINGGTDVNAGAETAAVGLGTRLVRLFSYFTIQSNILVLVAAVGLALDRGRDGPIQRVLRLDALLGIVITGAVFGTLLAGLVHHEGIDAWVNAGFHYVSPWLALLGWLLFGPRPRIDWQTVRWSLLWPALWIGYTLIHGAATGWYPYPFLDVADLGYAVALRNIALVLVGAAALALIMKALDGRLTAWPGSRPPRRG